MTQDAPDTALLDVDGTLLDSNYHHTLAWFRAFRRVDVTPPVWRVHRAVGMGGDHLVAAVAGDDVEDAHGDEIRAIWGDEVENSRPRSHRWNRRTPDGVTVVGPLRELLTNLDDTPFREPGLD